VIVFTLAFSSVPRAAHDHSGDENYVDNAPRITVSELKARIDKGENILILDVRAKQVGGHYGQLKIKDAVLMPLNEVEARVGEIPFGAMIAAYCT
jgi:rhodanese-related sulfurtransferase